MFRRPQVLEARCLIVYFTLFSSLQALQAQFNILDRARLISRSLHFLPEDNSEVEEVSALGYPFTDGPSAYEGLEHELVSAPSRHEIQESAS
jgi:hypothetical protein